MGISLFRVRMGSALLHVVSIASAASASIFTARSSTAVLKPRSTRLQLRLTAQGRDSAHHQQLNARLMQALDSEEVLQLTSRNCEQMNAVNIATALHRIAARNKLKRSRRDNLFRDVRFQTLSEQLSDALVEDEFDGSARSVADVLWSCATLQHWPPTLLVPALTAINAQLSSEAFEAQHLSTVVWALAKLECKPVRLLERIEMQAISLLPKMSMQNYANLAWGFAMLNYRPIGLLPHLSAELVKSGLLASAKPVEVADTAYALAKIGANDSVCTLMFKDLLLALAARAAPEAALAQFSSRQLVILICAFTQLEATPSLPSGRLDEWVAAVRTAHMAKSLLAADATKLEEALASIGVDASWIKSSDILNTWSGLAGGVSAQTLRRRQP